MYTKSRSLTDLPPGSSSLSNKEGAGLAAQDARKSLFKGLAVKPVRPRSSSLPNISTLQSMGSVTTTEEITALSSQNLLQGDSSNSDRETLPPATQVKTETTLVQEGCKPKPKSRAKACFDVMDMQAIFENLPKLHRQGVDAMTMLPKIFDYLARPTKTEAKKLNLVVTTASNSLSAFVNTHLNSQLLAALDQLPPNIQTRLAEAARNIKFVNFLWLTGSPLDFEDEEENLLTSARKICSKLPSDPSMSAIEKVNKWFLFQLRHYHHRLSLGYEAQLLDKMCEPRKHFSPDTINTTNQGIGQQACFFLKLMDTYMSEVYPKITEPEHVPQGEIHQLYLEFTTASTDYQKHCDAETKTLIWHRHFFIDCKLGFLKQVQKDLKALDNLACNEQVVIGQPNACVLILAAATATLTPLLLSMSDSNLDKATRQTTVQCTSAFLSSFNNGWLRGVLAVAEKFGSLAETQATIKAVRVVFTKIPELLAAQIQDIAQKKQDQQIIIDTRLNESQKKVKQETRMKKEQQQQTLAGREAERIRKRQQAAARKHHQSTASPEPKAPPSGSDSLDLRIKSTAEDLMTKIPLPTYEQTLTFDNARELFEQHKFAFVTALADQYIKVCNTEIRKLTNCFQHIKTYGDHLQFVGLPDQTCRENFNQAMRHMATINDTLPIALESATAAIGQLLQFDCEQGTDHAVSQQIDKGNFDDMVARYQNLTQIQFDLNAICELRRYAVANYLAFRDKSIPRQPGLSSRELQGANDAYRMLSSSFQQWDATITNLSEQLHTQPAAEQSTPEQ